MLLSERQELSAKLSLLERGAIVVEADFVAHFVAVAVEVVVEEADQPIKGLSRSEDVWFWGVYGPREGIEESCYKYTI